MTPATLMTMALSNTGLGETTERVDRARQYLNETGQSIYAWTLPLPDGSRRAIKWIWALKETTLSLTASTRAYALAADVMEPFEYFDITNDRWVPLSWISVTDHWDPDEDDGGDPERISITGRDATTGYWVVDAYPTPQAATTVRYRYYAQWTDLTSLSDGVDLNPVLPEWIQPALRAGISEMYFRQYRDLESAKHQKEIKEEIIGGAVARNTQAGNTAFRLTRPTNMRRFAIQEGSLG
jgi:hypothetical protein